MATNVRCRFDENNPKYWHGCCHIRTAAVIIGVVQLMGFMFELSNSAALASRMQKHLATKYKNQLNGSSSQILSNDVDSRYLEAMKAYGAYNGDPFESPYFVENASRSARNASHAAADVTWHALSALAVILLFYAIRYNRPYLMAPKFIFDAIAAGLASVTAVTMLSLAMGHEQKQPSQPNQAPLAGIMIWASVNLYFFWVTMRCFKYLLEKRAFLDTSLLNDPFISLPTFGIFDLPTRSAGATPRPNDQPPAYLTVVQEQPTVLKPTEAKPSGSTDETVPPSYEEAQRLQQQSTSTPTQ